MEGEDAYRARMRQTARASRNEKPIVQGEVIDAKQTYHPDIYGKAAFFMHTLRYIMGDSSFFPTLKQLATDPKYTYLNMVTTADLEALFSSAYGQSLSPVFYLFLRTTDKLDVQVKEVDEGQYLVRMPNAGMSLPIDVQTERGIERHLIPADGLRIASRTVPVIDPIGFYLKQVTIR
jgi:aminopeptidase N